MGKRRRNIFLSGPMRGLEDMNYPAFNRAAEAFRILYPQSEVFNPADAYGGDQSLPLRDYLNVDLSYLLECADTISFLPGWQGSEGALIEFSVARALKLDFILPDNAERIYDHEEWPEHAPVAYEAHRLVFGDRGAAYGHPAANFQDIAAAWNAQLGTNSIDAVEVANLMTIFKISRGKSSYKRDNVVDAIGYQVALQRVVDGL